MTDFIIIGGGITGTLIARALSRYKLDVLLLEKESDIGNHATIANSAIIHSGHDPIPNTLKAKLCVRGNALYETLHEELHIPLLRSGAFVVAKNEDDVDVLKTLYDRALKNGVKGAILLDAKEAKEREKNLQDDVLMVLDLPTTKVTYPWEVAIAALENAVMNGVNYRKDAEVTAIEKTNDGFKVTINHQETLQTKAIINAAGTYVDHIASLIEKEVPYTITPRRGEYFVLDKKVEGFINHVLYPVPSKKGKGVLIVPQVHGNILLGPTSDYQTEKDVVTNHKAALDVIRSDASKLAKNIPFNQIIRTFAGVRATSTYHDFYIQPSKEVSGFYHVAGIDSPGLTAAPAIAEYLVETIIRNDRALSPKDNYNPRGQHYPYFHALNLEEKRRLIEQNSQYGNIVCKCERVTEAEVVAHIHRPCGSDSIKGIKKRARAGSGMCQGGYCENTILKIIAREIEKPLTAIDYYKKGTPILLEETKVKS